MIALFSSPDARSPGTPLGGLRAARLPIVAGTIIVLAVSAKAQPAHKPLRRSQPASTAHSAPDMTGTIPTPNARQTGSAMGSKEVNPESVTAAKTAAALASLPDPGAPDVEPLPQDFQLPPASRAQMRACGLRWHEMKLNGEAGEEIWRDFATVCLASPVAIRSDAASADEPHPLDPADRN